MADTHTKEQRSFNMSKIKARNTGPEIQLRKFLFAHHFRGYRIHSNLPGKPDIVFTKKKVAVFIDGCFWHKCPECYTEPKSNRGYWIPKIQANVERDQRNTAELESMGWTVIRIWEHEIKKDLQGSFEKIKNILEKD